MNMMLITFQKIYYRQYDRILFWLWGNGKRTLENEGRSFKLSVLSTPVVDSAAARAVYNSEDVEVRRGIPEAAIQAAT
jgi:hypothetical protein